MSHRLFLVLCVLCCSIVTTGSLWSNLKREKEGFRSVRFVTEKDGFIAGPQGVYYSKDGGESWKNIPLTPKGSLKRIDGPNGSPLFHQVGNIVWADPDIALIRGTETLLIAKIQSGRMDEVRSSDQTYKSLQRISFVNMNDGWGISNGGTVYGTSNGGKTWQPVECGTFRSEGTEISKTPFRIRFTNGLKAVSSLELLAVTISGEIYHTIDGGCHWDQGQVGIPHEVRGIMGIGFFDDMSGWIYSISPPSLFMTSDGGKAWKQGGNLKPLCDALVAVSFAGPQKGWASAAKMTKVEPTSCFDEKSKKEVPCPQRNNWSRPDESKGEMILHTADSGESWHVQLRGIEDYFIDIQALQDGNVWAVGYNEGLVLHSKDEGKSWSLLRFDKDKVMEEKLSPLRKSK
jgi:photosystem II stability/assembly factor-like uncharacterized protein